jgi:hypothetical protein
MGFSHDPLTRIPPITMKTALALLTLAFSLPAFVGCSSNEATPKGDIATPSPQDSGTGGAAPPKNQQKVGGRGIPGK